MTLPAGWEGYKQNFLGLEEPWCHPDQAGVYFLPAPYEHTSSYVPGSDQGPSAIIEASHQVEFYDEVLRCEPYREWGGIATVQSEGFVAPQFCVARLIYRILGRIKAGRRVH